MKMNNGDSHVTALDRIRDAGVKFVSSLKAKREAIADLYAVYLDALSDRQVEIAIQRAFAALPKPPKSDNLASQICYLAVSSERRRVSEVKSALVDAHGEDVERDGMYGWLVDRARKHNSRRKGAARAVQKPAVHAFAAKMFAEAKHRSTLPKPPVPVACEAGDFLIQICEHQPNGKFIGSWIKASKADYEFLTGSWTSLASPAHSQPPSTAVTRADLVQRAQEAA